MGGLCNHPPCLKKHLWCVSRLLNPPLYALMGSAKRDRPAKRDDRSLHNSSRFEEPPPPVWIYMIVIFVPFHSLVIDVTAYKKPIKKQ